jgi:hypothetical protein
VGPLSSPQVGNEAGSHVPRVRLQLKPGAQSGSDAQVAPLVQRPFEASQYEPCAQSACVEQLGSLLVTQV